MNTRPTYQKLTAPHAQPDAKAVELDKDDQTPLTSAVVYEFAKILNKTLCSDSSIALLSEDKAQLLIQRINQQPRFPLRAEWDNTHIKITPLIDIPKHCIVKDLSDGITEIVKGYTAITHPNETHKFALARLFQPAIYAAYQQAGLSEGPHTKYTTRCC